MAGKWKRCHGILEAPQKSALHGQAAVMAYIMEFMACGGLVPLAQEDFRKMLGPWLAPRKSRDSSAAVYSRQIHCCFEVAKTRTK